MTGSMDAGRLHVSGLAFRSQIAITHPGMIQSPDIGMGSPIFRIPEFVQVGGKRRPPGYVEWEMVTWGTEMRYRWAAPPELKRAYGTDFWGHVKVEGEAVHIEVTDKNIGEETAPGAVKLFCLQAGTMREFQDPQGVNTFVWVKDRFVSFKEMTGGRFPEHRMVGFRVADGEAGEGEVTRKLAVKRSAETGFVLGVATDTCSSVGGNFQVWPSCIHANPDWGELEPGEEMLARTTVYFLRGTLEDVLARYVRDFEGVKGRDSG